MPPKLNLPLDGIVSSYNSGKSIREVAKEFGCSDGAIRNHFKANGIKARPFKRTLKNNQIVADYLSGKPMISLAVKYNCSICTIRDRLVKSNVELRPISQIMKGKKCSLGFKHGEEFCKQMSIRVKGFKHSNDAKQKMSVKMRVRWNIPGYREAHSGENNSTKRPEVRAKLSGENSPNWLGGISFKPYCPAFNFALKEEVRDKFHRKCYLCPRTELENGRKLDVHHVDYQKSQGCRGQRWSLIAMCHKCHNQTNYNRWYWFALLRDYWIYEHIDFFNF